MLPKKTLKGAILMTAAAFGCTVTGHPLQTYVVNSATGAVVASKPTPPRLPRQQPQSNSSPEMPDTSDYAKLTGGFEKWRIAIPILTIIPGSVAAVMIVYCILLPCCQAHFPNPVKLVKHVNEAHRKQLTLPQSGAHNTQVAITPADVNQNVVVTLDDLPDVGPTISMQERQTPQKAQMHQ